jgi:hypothetical protein
MASKDLRADGAEGLKGIERFLKILAWQLVVLILILGYMAIRPQAGRYQFLVEGEDAGLFDTAYGQARLIKMDREIQQDAESGGEPGSQDLPAGEGGQETLR